VIVDTTNDEWIRCDTEHEIEVTKPEVAGTGKLLLFTSPPGFNSGPESEATFLVEAKKEEEMKATAPNILGDTDLDGLKEMKEVVEEWHEWKDELPTAAPSSSVPALDQLCQVIDIYQDLLAIVAKYMNDGESFLERQLEDHFDLAPDSLALNNLEELAEFAGRSASLLIGTEKAMDLKSEILNLRSQYIERKEI